MFRSFTRRDFLKGMAVSGAALGSAGLLAACGSSNSSSSSGNSGSSSSSSGSSSSSSASSSSASTGTGDTTQSTDTTADASLYEVTEPIEITWWHALETQYDDLVTQIVDEFNASQSLVKVNAQYIGSYSDVNEALVAANAAGSGLPAVTVVNTPYLYSYAENGVIENLSPYIEATGFDMEDFGTGLCLATSYEDNYYSVPFLISTQVIYYNKDMAAELGVTIPENLEDWDDFLASITQYNADGTTSVYGTVVPGWDNWYYETLYLNSGVNIINDDNVTTDIDGEASVALTEKMQNWCNNGWAYWAYGTNASSIMRNNFYEGKAFSVLHTSSLYETYCDNCDFEVGMAWYPAVDGNKISEIGGCTLAVPANITQEEKNAAWVFIEYMCSKEVNMQWAEGTGYIPTRQSVLTTDEGQDFLEEKPEFQCIFDNLDLINPRIQHGAWNSLVSVWKSYLNQTMGENMDAASQMKAAAEEINEILEEYAE